MSQGLIRPEERALIEFCRRQEVGILTVLDPQQVGQGVFCGCSDADRMVEALDRHRQILLEQGATDRLHPFLINGGCLLLLDNPVGTSLGDWYLGNVLESLPLKGMTRVINYGHWPCGKAAATGRGILDWFDALLVLRMEVRARVPEIQTTLRFHIDWAPNQLRTYNVCQRRVAEYREELRERFPTCFRH